MINFIVSSLFFCIQSVRTIPKCLKKDRWGEGTPEKNGSLNHDAFGTGRPPGNG